MEWNEVKAKPKKVKRTNKEEDDGFYGGQTGNKLYAGALKGGGSGLVKAPANKQASAIADFDPLARDDGNEEIKYELVALECSRAVQEARLKKEMTQGELAKAVNEKAGLIHDIENGHAKYNADVINRIEKVLGVKIPRGRGGKKKSKKAPQF